MSLLSPLHLLRYGAANLGAPLLTAAAGWIAYSRLAIDHEVALPPALAAEHDTFSSVAGKLGYYVDRHAAGRPLVLLHSVNAAASAFEMRPLFEHFRGSRPVYALDLPGFGSSTRSDRDYAPTLYRDAIVDFLTAVVGAPADVIALSLGCEFAALAANLRPEAFRSLAFISPTGLSAEERGGDSPRARRVHSTFDMSLWRQPFYDLLVSRPSLKYFLKRSFVGEVDPGLLHYAFLTSHQKGAVHAPLCFISGRLFTPAIAESTYVRLQRPTLAIYDQDAHVSFERLPELMDRNKHWRAIRIVPTRGLPHWEKLPETVAALEAFWASADENVADDEPAEEASVEEASVEEANAEEGADASSQAASADDAEGDAPADVDSDPASTGEPATDESPESAGADDEASA
ncbi:MAG: alpha/beta fold hydrolase [Myxococcales bacterium]|nr:alpha/beta fold hydrolase [Myxococcales bacterium]